MLPRGDSWLMGSGKDFGQIETGEVWWILAEPRGENGAQEMKTFELFPTKKDATEALKTFKFGESCRPVPVKIELLA